MPESAIHQPVALRSHTQSATMSKIARDQVVKLIVGAGQASPSPPVGPALGSKGIKSMDFCKVRHHHILLRPSRPMSVYAQRHNN